MHPPLYRPHPDCQDVIAALVKCHEDHYLSKWIGFCNDEKARVDRCFRRERERKVEQNLAKARDFDARFEEYLKKCEEAEAQGIKLPRNMNEVLPPKP